MPGEIASKHLGNNSESRKRSKAGPGLSLRVMGTVKLL